MRARHGRDHLLYHHLFVRICLTQAVFCSNLSFLFVFFGSGRFRFVGVCSFIWFVGFDSGVCVRVCLDWNRMKRARATVGILSSMTFIYSYLFFGFFWGVCVFVFDCLDLCGFSGV